MIKKIKFSFFSIMVLLLFVFIIGLIISTISPNKTSKNKSIYLSSFNLEKEKYKGSYPDTIMIKGKINSNSNTNERIEIYYDRILQYSSLNYMKIEYPKITIFQDEEKIYYITSDIAFTENLDDIKIVNLIGKASIKDLKQNIEIKGDLLICNIERKEISSEESSLVIKDGFNIVSTGIYINSEKANFKKDVYITNDTGLYNSKIVNEFINFKGYSENAIFDMNTNTIRMNKNATVSSKAFDIKGDQILFYNFENDPDVSINYSQRIYVLNGYIKYININNDIFYSKGDTIDYKQGKLESYSLKNGYGYYKDNDENTYLYFNGETVSFFKDENKKAIYKINKGFFDQQKYNIYDSDSIISQFYSKGDFISLTTYKERNTYNCKNGFGYLYDLNNKNNVIFSGNNIYYVEKGETKISGNANIYDIIGKNYVKGDELIYYDDRKIVVSDKPFFLRQFNSDFNYTNQSILKGIRPNFENDFLKLPSDNYKYIVNDVSALKGKMNTEDSSCILEKKVNIIDYQNLILIVADYATYSGKEDQIYKAENNLTIYQYDSINNIKNNKQLEIIIQSDRATVYKKDNLAYFEGEPKIKNFKDNFYIQSDLLEAHLDTKVYVFKDNIKLLVNTSENKELENQIYILGQYAVYDSEKKIITFSGNSILYQKNMELKVLEIFVDFDQKVIKFKGIKDSKIKSIKF